MTFNNLILSPPGGWKYWQPETQFWMSAVTFLDLIRKVSQHRANNKLPQFSPPFTSLMDELQDSICRTLTERDQARLCTTTVQMPGVRPGDLFSTLIHKITGRSALTCGVCGQRMKQMNDWGWWKCWKNRDRILGWLREEASKRGHQIGETQLWDLFRAAWKEIRAE